jgi:hypothetical protein
MDEPNIIEKTKNLTGAMVNWATKDGFSRVPTETFHLRKQFCDSCPHWNKDAFAGLGGCRLCGCSVGKLYIPSSICPDHPPRWLSVFPSDN